MTKQRGLRTWPQNKLLTQADKDKSLTVVSFSQKKVFTILHQTWSTQGSL